MNRKPKDRRAFEKKIVCEMIDLYDRKHPEWTEGEALKAYASMRVDRCPMMETKTFCSACKIHCYQREKREQIRMVMRYSGPRMLLHHPLMTLHHLWIEHEQMLAKAFWVCFGMLGLVLGFIGAILPLLPAFPFLLMAAVGFGKSSKRLNDWFLSTKLYKNNIQDWVETRSMDRKAKIRVLSMISAVMAIGLFFTRRVPWVQLILLAVWAGHVLYFIYGIAEKPAKAI